MADKLTSEPIESSSMGGNSTRRDMLRLGGVAAFSATLAGGAFLADPMPALAAAAPAAGSAMAPLDIVIAIYDKGTLLDFAGPCEIFRRLPNTRVRIASINGGPVTLEFGVIYGNTEKLSDIAGTDMLLVPGGGDLTSPTRPEFLAQIQRLAAGAKHITSVCTGSLVLAAAGILKGKRSACHWAFVNRLADYGAIPVPDRFVQDDDGRFMSGGGVTSGIDFALRVAEELRGKENAEFAQLIIEYDPDPPFRSGHPRVAPPEILAMVDAKVPGASKGMARMPGLR